MGRQVSPHITDGRFAVWTLLAAHWTTTGPSGEHSLTLIEWRVSARAHLLGKVLFRRRGGRDQGGVIDTSALSLWRPSLTSPAGNMCRVFRIRTHSVEMCKTPTECSRDARTCLWSTMKKTGGLRLISGNTYPRYRSGGQLAVSRPSLHLCLKMHKKVPPPAHKFTQGSHYLNFKQFERRRKRSARDEIHRSEGIHQRNDFPYQQ